MSVNFVLAGPMQADCYFGDIIISNICIYIYIYLFSSLMHHVYVYIYIYI